MKLLTIIFTFVFSVLVQSQSVVAESISDSDNSNKNIIEKIDDSNENKKIIAKRNIEDDIFGDEQTFPFVAGLGKNAAH